MTTLTNNLQLTVLTPNGFEPFIGINKINKDRQIKLSFSNGTNLVCSDNHPLVTIDGIKTAIELVIGDFVDTNMDGCFVIDKELIDVPIEMYDLIDVGTDSVYYTNGILSHNCNFLGSSGTLISGKKLQQLTHKQPLEVINDSLYIYEHPIQGNSYISIIDVAEGMGKDYSVISIIDVTEKRYKQVAVYRNNQIVPFMFADESYHISKKYNDAYIVIESNSVGTIVANILYYEYEYENMLTSKSKQGDTIITDSSIVGIRQTKKTKLIGCSTLKNLIESDTLELVDYNTITELTMFIKKGTSYEAERGKHDDIVMTLVIFAWLTSQDYFYDLTNLDTRMSMRENYLNNEESNHLIFGFFSDGT